MVNDIINIYLANRFYFLSRILELYNQRALAGELISESHRQKWAVAFGELNLINHARSRAPARKTSDMPESVLDRDVASRWLEVSLFPEQEFDANVAMSLSAVLRGEMGRRLSPETCAVAEYYLAAAQNGIDAVVEDGKLGAADRASLHQYTSAIADRVKTACG